jgi:hypothetical protein
MKFLAQPAGDAVQVQHMIAANVVLFLTNRALSFHGKFNTTFTQTIL